VAPMARQVQIGARSLRAERLSPSFTIIGTMRGGTTGMFDYLCSHPNVAAPFRKEVHYFDFNWHRSSSWYRAHFPLVSEAPPDAITGEASPFYLSHPLVPRRMRETVPAIKLIALLRNPVRRAISHYFMAVRLSWERRSIREAFARPEAREPLEQALEQNPRLSHAHRLRGYIVRGFYADELSRWYEQFDRSAMLVLRSEDLFADVRTVYEPVARFLDLDAVDLGPLVVPNAGRYPDVDPGLVRELEAIYAEPNRRLAELLGTATWW
jgi:lipopolysaccharide transport system ATP-binding protein